MTPWETLRSKYPWPIKLPAAPPVLDGEASGWFAGHTKQLVFANLPPSGVVVELGSWLGLSARNILDHNKNLSIVCVDHWKGSKEHVNYTQCHYFLPVLYETFVVNCWRLQDRIVPLRETTLDGLQIIKDSGLEPHMIYVDASHETNDVLADVRLIMKLFPKTIIVGDDWCWEKVKKAVEILVETTSYKLETTRTGWVLKP
jgi:hypothetical protein